MKNILHDIRSSGTNKAAVLKPGLPTSSAIIEAEKIVSRYHVIVERHERLGYFATAIEMPGTNAHGKTPNDCFKEIHQALIASVATLIDAGQPVPDVCDAARSIQINLRVTPREKVLMTHAAKRLGFRGLSDFLRRAALKQLQE
jgi:predicted RNase H-like HicB family nuclease